MNIFFNSIILHISPKTKKAMGFHDLSADIIDSLSLSIEVVLTL